MNEIELTDEQILELNKLICKSNGITIEKRLIETIKINNQLRQENEKLKEIKTTLIDCSGDNWEEKLEHYLSIDDRCCELEEENNYLKEELKNLKQDIEDNYRPIPVSEQVGISDRDFI